MDRVKLPRPINRNLYDFDVLQCFNPLQQLMASLNTKKRKLTEDSRGVKIIKKSHKLHHSDHPPSSSIDHQSEAPPVKKVARRKRASDTALSSSADQTTAINPTRVGHITKIAQKQKAPSPEFSSLEEGDVSIADPTNANADLASHVAPITVPTPVLVEVSGKGNDSEVEASAEDNDDDDKEEYDTDEDDENEDSSSGVEDYSREGEEEESGSEGEGRNPRAARSKAPAKPQAHSRKNRVGSDSESTNSSESTIEWGFNADSGSDAEPLPDRQKKNTLKSDDPDAFASSMSKILGYKLSRTQRANPILARSADAKAADEALADMKLEKKARAEMKREKLEKAGLEPRIGNLSRGVHGEGAGDVSAPGNRIKESEDVSTVSAYYQHEKELRKTAQRGVVKMFNAFAHVREKAAETQGPLGSKAGKEKATEMSKEGWLEFVGQGGKDKVEGKAKGTVVE